MLFIYLPFVELFDAETGKAEVGADRVGPDEIDLAIYRVGKSELETIRYVSVKFAISHCV